MFWWPAAAPHLRSDVSLHVHVLTLVLAFDPAAECGAAATVQPAGLQQQHGAGAPQQRLDAARCGLYKLLSCNAARLSEALQAVWVLCTTHWPSRAALHFHGIALHFQGIAFASDPGNEACIDKGSLVNSCTAGTAPQQTVYKNAVAGGLNGGILPHMLQPQRQATHSPDENRAPIFASNVSLTGPGAH